MSGKGCFRELLLALGMLLAMGVFFTWAMAMPGQVGLPVLLVAMVITALGLVVVASKVHQAEKGVKRAGDVAERNGGDPIAPVTRRARSGCGVGLALLALLGVCGVLVWMFSIVGGL